MKTDNELIAEFMGFLRTPQRDGVWKIYWHPEKDVELKTIEMAFEHSWDWLMPVVEKIEKTKHLEVEEREFIVTIDSSITIISENGENPVIEEHGYNTRIENTYHAIVRFIKWYKSQKP